MTTRIQPIISTTSMYLIDPINALCRVIERAERKQRRHTGAAARTRRIDSPAPPPINGGYRVPYNERTSLPAYSEV
jgi:hypothetical protein